MHAEDQKLRKIIGSLKKPFEFASRDGFSHIDALKGLSGLVERLCNNAAGEKAPEGTASLLNQLKDLSRGFDHLASEEKKERITKGMKLIDLLSELAGAGEVGEGDGAEGGEPPRENLSAPEAAGRLKRLTTPVESIKGVGPGLAARLDKKGLNTVEDLLYFLPLRYEDRSRMKKIRELAPGQAEVTAAEVQVAGEVRYGRKRVYEVVVSDGTGLLSIKWFNYKPAYMKRYQPGRRLIIFGTVSRFGGRIEMVHPVIEILDEEEPAEKTSSGAIVPVYSQLEGLHQKTIRKIVKCAVDEYARSVVGGAPAEVLKRHGLMGLAAALREVHSPQSISGGRPGVAERSIFFDELFLLELGLALKRERIKRGPGARSFKEASRSNGLEKGLRDKLPFKLTAAQERVLVEIKQDMSAPHPMNRLIQGDVGSGKTVVSFIASLWAIGSGLQAAIMAPTEILAEQHYINTRELSEDAGIRTVLLTGGMPAKKRAETLEGIRAGDVGLVVGTHALIQKDVEFKRLGLAVIDEQHRFGVVQRGALKGKGPKTTGGEPVSPDILIMTATPIPRTLSMTVFGDLDVSIIDELPPSRRPVETRLLREKDRRDAYEIIRKEVLTGGQAYIVYPLVEESEELSLRDATNMKEHLQEDIFREFKVGLLHGRMKSSEKESVMREFKKKEINILVSTTVIEVGVDVPDATVILIEHAERFGLAQLHQLRGRVGRGRRKSLCLLLAQWTASQDTYRRLKVMERTNDGFRIAEEDLKIRGPGDFVGQRQSGLPDFRFAGAFGDTALLKAARSEAFAFLAKNPGLAGPGMGALQEVLRWRWASRLGMAEIG